MSKSLTAIAFAAAFSTNLAAASDDHIVVKEYPLEDGVLTKGKATLLIFPGANTDGSDLRCLKFSTKSGYAGMGGLSCHWSGTPTKNSAPEPEPKEEPKPRNCTGRACSKP